MQQWQPEIRDQSFRADNLINWRRSIPVHIIMNSVTDHVGHVFHTHMIEFLPKVPHFFLILLGSVNWT